MSKLKEIYDALPMRTGAKGDFIANLARVTRSQEGSVKHWLCGTRVPNKLAKKEISKYLGIKEEEI